jgi:hypothetical protein
MGNQWVESREGLVENRLVQLSDYVVVTYEDADTAKLVCWLPAGAIVLDVLVNVTTLFNAAGDDYMQVGTADDPDAYCDDLTLAAAEMVAESQNTTPVVPGVRLTEDTAIYATYEYSSTAPTTGSAQVSILWVPSHRSGADG